MRDRGWERVTGFAGILLMVHFFSGPGDAVAARAFPDLTDREREILILIAKGRSNGQIAQRLLVSDKTVRNHISNLFSKLQVAHRSEAIVRAREAGLGRESGKDG